MNTRRDFLAFTAGAVMARTLLPIAARADLAHKRQSSVCEQPQTARRELESEAEPDPVARTDLERRFLLVFRQLGEPEQAAFLRGLQRQQAGMPMLEAMRGVYVELGRPVPPDLLGGTA